MENNICPFTIKKTFNYTYTFSRVSKFGDFNFADYAREGILTNLV